VSDAPRAARRLQEPGGSLPFQLPSPSPLPGRIAPEAAVPCATAFDADGWWFSIDWDGTRALMFVDGGEVRLQAETLADLTPRFPELSLAGASLGRAPLVLDGVIAVLDPRGRPDLESLALRLVLGAAGAAHLPTVFLATDVLHLDGAPANRWPLNRRLAALAGIVRDSAAVQAPDHVEGRGLALAEAAGERGLSAVLARRATAPYRPGVASPDRLRVSLRQQTTCVVAGVDRRSRARAGLVLGELVDGVLTCSGSVPGPRHAAVERWLAQAAARLEWDTPPRGAEGFDARWIRPVLAATVSHRGRLPDGSLREPALIAVRDDVDTAWCVRRDPVPPPDEDAGARFAPTVLMPLPLGDAALLPRRPG
jgi:bifunctional non-homologous end joining protein LigD